MSPSRHSRSQAESIIRANADLYWVSDPHGWDAMRSASVDEWDVMDTLASGDVYRSRTSGRWCVEAVDGLIVVVELEAADHVTVVTTYRP